MKKIIKVLPYICMAISILIAICYGCATKTSWNDNTELSKTLVQKDYELVLSDTEEEDSFLLAEDVNSFNKLCASADLIVRIKVEQGASRKMYTDCVVTAATVLKVYQGNYSDKKIFVFEPACVENDMLMGVGSYLLAEEGKEYILFLKELKNNLYSENGKVYLPTTTGLSKYQVLNDTVTGKTDMLNNDKVIKYSKVKEFDALFNDKNLKKMHDYYSEQIQLLISPANKCQ